MLPDFRVKQRDYLLEISRALTEELDLDKLLGRILKISIEMLAGQAGLIALRSVQGNWHIKVSHALKPAFLKFVEPFLSEIKPDPSHSEAVQISEINRMLNELTRAASMGSLTGFGLPLVARKSVVGVIFIFRGYRGAFSPNDQMLLRSFADQAAIAVQNAQLYHQVIREKSHVDGVLDSVVDGILILSTDHTIERCNTAILRMLGKEMSEIIGKPYLEVLPWKKKSEGITLEEAEVGGWPLTPDAHLYLEVDIKRNEEMGVLPASIIFTPLLSEDGSLANVILTLRDISRFRQADEMKSTFISIISHELKTPIALIKGYVGTLRRDDASWDREIVEDSLEVIEEEADRLASLIENLLDATRLQAGGMSLKGSDVSIPRLAGRLAERFQIQTENHELSIDFPDDFPIVLADEDRLTQVLSNLISNAMKYSTQGEIKIKGMVRDEFVIICVLDEGPGFSPDDVPYVFDRFYRAPDMAKKTKGAGLGLYLTRAIIEAHNGRIWIDTNYENGGRICFSLPRNPEF